ncbi:kinase-like domain-containing protein [Absidia repens]|uniref:non-specific serine/threonine protein kinase n=1 Tax=Absidia repens TaxID=90262 RepID=A0A1X2IAW5_9FUNG|nr:kinase-like domain-containing protein [Absidia repens]
MHSLYVYSTPANSTHTSPISLSNKYSDNDHHQGLLSPGDSTVGALSDEEDINDYKQGGYHVVQVGDSFYNGRYIIDSKMGWGYFSTVWLAKDTLANQYVALKIVKSDPHFCKSALEEIELLEQAQAQAQATSSSSSVPISTDDNTDSKNRNKGHQHVAQLLHHFWHDASLDTPGGGKHVCMVFEVLGENLLSVMKRFNYRGLPVNMVKRITRQILDGLSFLHNACGIVHTDIKPENILIWIPEVESYLENQRGESNNFNQRRQSSSFTSLDLTNNITLMAPSNSGNNQMRRKVKRQQKRTEDPPVSGKQTGGNKRLDEQLQSTFSELFLNVPQQRTEEVSSSPPMIIRSEALDCTTMMNTDEQEDSWHDKITVKIVDLGNACRVDGKFKHVIQTRQYRSPEVIVGMVWNDRADIWSLGCLVYELLTGDYLFDPRIDSKYGKDEDHLAKIIELMRVLPRSLTFGGDYSREFFNNKGAAASPFKDVLHDTYFMPPEQADSISEFLSLMLEVDMAKRASANNLLDHSWLTL